MDHLRAPPLAHFAVLSLVAHAAWLVALRVSAPNAGPRFETTEPSLAGDTLDVEEAVTAGATADEQLRISSDEGSPPPPQRNRRVRGAPVRPSATAETSELSRAFGAVGVRYATDLPTAFTRAFPQAASADALWSTAPFGSAGEADVTLSLNDEGRIDRTSIAGAPSSVLRRGIERTLALLGARPFVARAAVSRLRIRARIGRDDVHDGLHGDVFALSGGSFAGETGVAFFALPAQNGGDGRRVDVELRLLP